ncbi:MAG: dockerin type I repeat-containing protein [Prevotella sp.]|nr:dockerin type I repeat-containing protein [Prevotella sp.]
MTKRIRYLTLLVLLLGSIGTWAQDDGFNPASPAEPGEPPTKLILVASPSEGGSVYGSGKYAPGTMVSLRASNQSGFVFTKWTNARGEVLSTSSAFTYEKQRGDETLTAHFDFAPGNPGEPTEIAQAVFYWLTLAAEEGGSVSGGGRYKPGTKVTVRATAQSTYVFTGWYDGEGTLLSTDANYQYEMTAQSTTLTARFRFDPSSPDEPQEPAIKPKHLLTVTAQDGGTVNISSQRLMEGTSTVLRATPNEGYAFTGWYADGELYTQLREFSYTMGTADVNFEARFEFSPQSPVEPNTPQSKKYAFYLMNKVTKPGQQVDFPIYLTSLDELHDITFQLTFTKPLVPDLQNIALSEKASGYTLSYNEPTDTTIIISLTGGTTSSGNTALLTITVPIAETIATAQGYPIKINQVSVTEHDGTTITASTRNGRISVYKLGDTNGDNEVNITDKMNLVQHVLGEQTDTFIEEVADVSDDGEVNITDAMGIVEIILNE